MGRGRLLVISLGLLVPLVACGSDAPEADPTIVISPPPPPTEPTTTDVSTTEGPTTSASSTTVAVVRTTLAPVTAPPTVAPPTTAAGITTTTIVPQVKSFNVTPPVPCPLPEDPVQDTPLVIVTWSFAAVDAVYVAIDNENGPYQVNLPPTGELQVPFACPGPHTYYAVGTRGAIRVVASKMVEPTPPPTTTTVVEGTTITPPA